MGLQNLNQYIDLSTGNLITSLSSSAAIPASSLQLFIGDTPFWNVFLLNRIPNLPSPTQYPFQVIPANTVPALQCFITDGTYAGPNGDGNPYTQLVNWGTDPTGTFFTGQVPLNTASLKTLVATTTKAQATLKFGLYQNGYPNTIFSDIINLGVGIPSAPAVVPVPQTALSVQVANQTYMPIQPIPGQPLYLAALDGTTIEIVYVKNPDGTYSLQENQLNPGV